MARMSQRERDRLRRETVERYHVLKDAEEDYERDIAATASAEERQAVTNEFAEFRRQHREADIRRGKRAPGGSVQMHQIMWARWIEIAATHERAAQDAFAAICSGQTERLRDELQHALVAIAAAASTVEALHEDVRYLIPDNSKENSAAERISHGLSKALGLSAAAAQDLLDELGWLFERRNEGLHAYSEPEAPQLHPSGLNTSAEASRFNGPESTKALQVALKVLGYAADPPQPANRWVTRWANTRAAHHCATITPIREALALRPPPDS